MHERHARWLALAIGAVVVAAAFAFAGLGRPAPPPAADAHRPAPAATRGERLFVELGCADCHAFRGVGDPSGALDDAASRADRAELERCITAAPAVAGELSRKARAAKARYAALPREDLDALLDWLQQPPP